jgi:hypothetical protein
MHALIRSIEAEYLRYKALAETALAQVPEASLSQPGPAEGNSLAIICWHLSGNLKSRFTDFLTSDGEKPWRDREEQTARVSRAELIEKWDDGWRVLLDSLGQLTDDDLTKTVRIVGKPRRARSPESIPGSCELPCGSDRVRRPRDLRSQLALSQYSR